MAKNTRFIRKYRIHLGIGTFVFITIPEWVDALWSLIEREQNMSASGLNITWLYLITAPVGLGMLAYIIWQSNKVSPKESKTAWGHYNKLVDLIISTETEPHDIWNAIVANMQRELNAIGDKKINKYMSYYFSVLDERQEFGIHPSRGVSQLIINLTREHMIRKYKRW